MNKNKILFSFRITQMSSAIHLYLWLQTDNSVKNPIIYCKQTFREFNMRVKNPLRTLLKSNRFFFSYFQLQNTIPKWRSVKKNYEIHLSKLQSRRLKSFETNALVFFLLFGYILQREKKMNRFE